MFKKKTSKDNRKTIEYALQKIYDHKKQAKELLNISEKQIENHYDCIQLGCKMYSQ